MNKIPWGKDRLSGRMMYVDDVPNGKACGAICPGCLGILIAKNRGNVVVHHFAHNGNATGCDRWTHDTAVKLLLQRINDTLSKEEELPLKWQCDYCRCTHDGNLLKGISTCKKEQPLNGGSIRSDLVLYGEGRVKKLIEVVDTHKLEPTVQDYASSKSIPLLVINVSHGLDPAAVVLATPLTPDHVHNVQRCPCDMCQHCNKVPICEEYHRYCKACGECVTDVTDYDGYGAHGHCTECGKVLYGRENNYGRHYCCYARKRFGLPSCPKREHQHCKRCGQLTKRGRYEFYECCYSCYQKERATEEKSAREASLETVENWYGAYPDWPKPTFVK